MFQSWLTKEMLRLPTLPVSSTLQLLPALLEVADLLQRLLEPVVVADDGAVLRHQIAQLLGEPVRVLLAVHLLDGGEALLPVLLRVGEVLLVVRVVGALGLALGEGHHGRAADHAAVDAGEQRVGAQAVRAVVRVVRLARGVQAGDVGGLVDGAAHQRLAVRARLEVHVQAAHRVVHGREDLHRVRGAGRRPRTSRRSPSRRLSLAVEHVARDVRDVQVDLVACRRRPGPARGTR